MSTPTVGNVEQPTRAAPLPSRAAAEPPPAAPVAPTARAREASANLTSSGNLPEVPGKPEYGDWELGIIGLGSEEGITGQTNVESGILDVELEAFDLLNKLGPSIANLPENQQLPYLTEIISRKLTNWQTQAKTLQLFRIEIEGRRKIEAMPVDPRTPRQGKWRDWGASGMEKRKAEREFEKKITDRKKNIKEIVSMKEDSDTNKQVKLKKIQSLRDELKIDARVTGAEFKAMMEAYANDVPQHIFGNLNELYKTNIFLEEAEKLIAAQAGFDMTNGGARTINFDLSPQNIDRLLEQGVDSRIVQALRDIGQRIHVGDMRGVEEIIAAGGVGLIEYLGVLGGLGGPEAAVGGVAGMALAKIITRKIYKWYMEFPDKKDPDRATFTLGFQRVRPEMGDTTDPIRSRFRGDTDGADFFLKSCDEFRVKFAHAIKVHPGELEGWLNLSDQALTIATAGMKLPHRIALTRRVNQILKSEFKKPDGSNKNLSELIPDEYIEVITRAYDNASMDIGHIDETEKNIFIYKILEGGKKTDWTTRNSALSNHIQAMKDGKVWYHRKEGAQTVEEAKAAKDQAEAKKNKLGELKTQFAAQVGTYRTKENEFETARQESEKIQLINGHVMTGRDPTTSVATYVDRGGKISIKNAEQTRKDGERTRLYADIGVNPATGAVAAGSLFEHYTQTKTALASATADLETKQKQKDAADTAKTRLESLPTTTATTAAIAAQEAIVTACDADLPGLRTTVTDATKEHNKYKTPYESKAQKISEIETRLVAIPEEVETLREAVLEKDALLEAARLVRNNEFNKIKEILRDFGYTEEEMNAVDFAVPTEATLMEKINVADADLQKQTRDYNEMKARVDAGNAAIISDEDKEVIKLLQELSPCYKMEFLNSLMADCYEGKIDIEQYGMVANDEGYHLILKRLRGEDALSTGPEGKYRLVTQLFSKARLVDAITEVWRLDGRAERFFVGDAQGLKIYQDSQFIKQTNKRLAERINQLEYTRPTPADATAEITRLRAEFKGNEIKRNELLAQLYDRSDQPDKRLASFLAQDRIKTAEVFRVTLNNLYDAALNGFVEHVPTNLAARSELAVTSVGSVVISEAAKDSMNRQIIQRGEFNVQGMVGYPGIVADVKLTTDSPVTGNIDVSISIDRDHGGLDLLPNLPPAGIPNEARIAYGDVNSRRFAVNPQEFTQEMLDSIPHATRVAARAAGIGQPNLLDLLYGPDDTSPKKSLNQVRASTIDMTMLPNDRTLLNAPEIIKDFFYYYTQIRRKETLNWSDNILAVTTAHTALPATRANATAAGFTPQMLDMFYGANAGDPPRSIADLQTGKDRSGADFHLEALPYQNTLPATIPVNVRTLFYELRGRKRNNFDTDAYIDSLPANKTAALASGLSTEAVNLLYEAGVTGNRRNARDVRKIIIPRDHTTITNVNRLVDLVNSFSLKGAIPAREVFFHNIAESFSTLDEVSKIRMFGDKFVPFDVGPTHITFVNGEVYVTYEDATSHNRYPMRLNEFIKNQAYPPEVGAYLAAHVNHKNDIVQNVGRNIIETVRQTNI